MLKHTSWDFLAKEHGLKQCQSKDTCRVDSLLYETKKVIASQSIVVEEEVAQNNSTQSTAIQSKTHLQALTSPSSDIIKQQLFSENKCIVRLRSEFYSCQRRHC